MATSPNLKSSLDGPRTFSNDLFKVKGMMYPDDLMRPGNNEYGGNYVIFYINVHEDSYLAKSENVAAVQGNITPNMAGSARGLTEDQAYKAVVGGAAVTAAAGGKILAGSGLAKSVVNLGGGALVGAAAVTAVGGSKKEYKTLNSVVALHVPNELSTRYSAQWGAEEFAGTQALAAGSESLDKAKQVATAFAGSMALKTPGAGQMLSKSSGIAGNPKKEQLFQEVDFRTFTFAYQFFPRSKTEAENIQRIIKTFKLHMHPEYKPDTGQFLYIYPSEFDIVYYQNGVENMNLHRHTSCVITDLNVSYSPQGTFATFVDGMPTQINLTMTFKELALLTKETIEKGF